MTHICNVKNNRSVRIKLKFQNKKRGDAFDFQIDSIIDSTPVPLQNLIQKLKWST